MKKSDKKLQIFLLIIGTFLILITYFYYPSINKNRSLVEKNIEDTLPQTSEDEDVTSFESLEYQGYYDLDKKFVVRSKKAEINKNEPDIVLMNNMHVILYLKDGRVINIFSDKGKYNKENYDCFFERNVRATDGETEIFSDNLDLLGNESAVKIYNNVSLNNPSGSSLYADKIDYDFEKKHFKISMFEDKRIKMKVYNE
tara:strand:- start:131 stop:727 length:597 start_codon:yes stop_codon:yes gene_type:complete